MADGALLVRYMGSVLKVAILEPGEEIQSHLYGITTSGK